MTLLNFFLILSIFLLLILNFFHPISAITQDLGRHLLTGKIIWETKAVPLTNLYSYTYPDFPFINHHWLSEVIFYFIHSLTGFNGLLIFTILIVVLAFFLVFFSPCHSGLDPESKPLWMLNQVQHDKKHRTSINNVLTITVISLLYVGILLERTDVRPEVFSFLFLSLFITILYKNRQSFTRWIFLLPFLELLWVNMHIYFIAGIAVIGLFWIDEIVSYLIKPNTKIRNPKQIQITKIQNTKYFVHLRIRILNIVSNFDIRILNLLIILLFSILATLLNPNDLSGALYPFKVFNNYGYSIEENQNIFFLWNYFHKPTIVFFAISAVLLFSVLLINIKKTKLIDWLLAIFFTILGAVAIRNFPLFVFATFIPFTQNLSFLFSKVRPSNKVAPYAKVTPFVLAMIIVWQIFSIFSSRPIGFGVEKGAQNATDFFINKNLKGPIFNNFDVGSYLEYRLYPGEKVFVDGRPEAYPSEFFQKTYIPMQQNLDIFKQVAFRYNFNSIFFTHNDQTPWAQAFLKQIIQDDSWKMIYLDEYAVIFVKDITSNKDLINKYLVTDKNFKLNEQQKTTLVYLYRLANFFNTVNWIDQQENVFQSILAINPNSCPTLYNLAQLLSRKQSPLSSVFIQRFSLNCK